MTSSSSPSVSSTSSPAPCPIFPTQHPSALSSMSARRFCSSPSSVTNTCCRTGGGFRSLPRRSALVCKRGWSSAHRPNTNPPAASWSPAKSPCPRVRSTARKRPTSSAPSSNSCRAAKWPAAPTPASWRSTRTSRKFRSVSTPASSRKPRSSPSPRRACSRSRPKPISMP